MSYTPGPWHVNSNEHHDVEVRNSKGKVVCKWYNKTEIRSKGDPVLISSAPELLGAMRRMLEDMTVCACKRCGFCEARAIIARIDADLPARRSKNGIL